jgi:hypothetical protein
MAGSTRNLAVFVAVGAVVGMAEAGCGKDQFNGAEAEVTETNIKLDLPAVPQFDMPKTHADGSHPVAEMRLKGNKFLDTEVRVRGYVIWKYECATAIRTPDMSDADVARILRDEPERCNRPNFYLGDQADAPTDRGIWVVGVPRPPREDELKTYPKEELANWPKVPVYELGQELIVTGTWTLSGEGFIDSSGLLVYKDLIDPNAPAPTPTP